MRNDAITRDEVLAAVTYNPHTGLFTRKGKKAGWVNDNGYLIITLKNKDYRAHRLAYLIMVGDWPSEDVDHINRIRTDNRWCNLRCASRTENHFNRKIQKNNKTGVKNVSVHQGKFRVEIRKKGKRVYDSMHGCLTAASLAAQCARVKIAGDFAHHSTRLEGN